MAETGNEALGGRMGWGRTPALVVIDLQLGFTDPEAPLGADVGAAIEVVNNLIAGARAAAVPVIFTTCVWSDASLVWSRKIPAQPTLAAGSKWVELDPRLDYHEGDRIVEKSLASAFFDTGLATELRAMDADAVVLTGVTTSGCVRASAVDACSSGFLVAVPRDAVADREQATHEMSLKDLDTKYADVMSSDEVLAYFADLP
ncbi:MAG: isochorismatase family protein [Nocardioidaceae bacterium]|nr:MAG: isochorismatase family protein [Nocardioidaceae bacterium]